MTRPDYEGELGGEWAKLQDPICIDVALSVGTGVAMNDAGVTSDAPVFWAFKFAMSDKRIGTIVLNDFAAHKLYLTMHNQLGDHTS